MSDAKKLSTYEVVVDEAAPTRIEADDVYIPDRAGSEFVEFTVGEGEEKRLVFAAPAYRVRSIRLVEETADAQSEAA